MFISFIAIADEKDITKSYPTYNVMEIEVEKPLEVEEWMVIDSIWTEPTEKRLCSHEKKESPLTIEDWMLDNKIWK